jgi:prepilin-type N-terminal cleavage/methylation domain-containing protein
MKTEFKAKFLQHVAKKRKEEGFTLIELLVVIIIIGILSAIALPSFLSQANKAKQSEAKTYIGSLNKSQQAYYVEKNAFSDSIKTLGVGIQTQTTNYKYACKLINDGTASLGGQCTAQNPDDSTTSPLRRYGGFTYIVDATDTSDATTTSTICETDKNENISDFNKDNATNNDCPTNSSKVGA